MKRILNQWMVCCCFLMAQLNAHAQASQTQYFAPLPFPRSPTSTALEKYGSYQVNEFTGVPNIAIPLYTIDAGGLQVPITLSYHASGNKVTEVASWAGLGWSVSAGGSVTRRTMGLADDVPNGYLTGIMKPSSSFNTLNFDTLNYLEDVAKNLYDTRPDIYSYDFPGHGGKFFFDGSSGNSFPVRMMPYAPLSIKYNYVNEAPYAGITRFNIADDHGNIFAFGDAGIETTTTASGGVPGLTPVNTAWMLENMISQNRRDTVSFTYNTQSVNMPEADSEVFTVTDNVDNLLENDYSPSYTSAPTTPGNSCVTVEKVPQQINFKNGKVIFDLDDSVRADIGQVYGANNARGLKDIKVYLYNYSTSNYEVQKTIKFYKSYFNPESNTFSKRLKLDSIQVLDKTGVMVQHYLFDYNTNLTMPDYTSKQIDYWGYYNGKNNDLLTPQQTIDYHPYSNGEPSEQVTIGSRVANGRDCDSNYMQVDMLTGIHYPTGGYTGFTYETNQYFSNGVYSLAGGLRVKSISSYDGINPVPITKTYVYNTSMKNYLLDFCYFSTEQNHRTFGFVQDGVRLFATESVRSYVSSPHIDLEPYDAATVVYPSVTEYTGTPANNIGKTDYLFTYQSDAASDASMAGSTIIISSFYNRGQLASKTDYLRNADSTYQVVKTVNNSYTAFPYTNYQNTGLVVRRLVYNEGIGSNPVTPGFAGTNQDDTNSFLFPYYDIVSDDNYLTGTTVTDYDLADTTKFVTTATYYNYGGDTTHQQIIGTTTVNSKGDTTIATNVYPFNYAPGNPVIDTMVSQHIWADAIEKYDTLKKINGTVAIIGGQLNRYGADIYGRTVMPADISTLSVSSPIADFVPSTVDTGVLTSDPRYVKMISFDAYDSNNNIAQYTTRNATPVSIIWDYENNLPIAQVKNAAVADVAYTSFEAGGSGKWYFNGTPVADTTAPTGSMCYLLSSGSVSSPYLNTAKPYVLSYWGKGGPATVTADFGTLTGAATQTANGWTCYEYQVPTGTGQVILSGTVSIDELRLYPAGAQMSTYAYEPAGLQTTSDAKGENTHYEYDDFQRLLNIKDKNGSIIKNYAYQYANAPAPPTVYYSAMAQGTYYRDNCGPDSLGSAVTYTVNAHKYTSVISQGYADTLAINEVNARGQARADSLGSCHIIVYLSNDADSTFTHQPCGADSTGLQVTYYLQQGAYTSTISQAVADSLAQDDIRRNGQAYADSVGGCTPDNPVIQYISLSLGNGTEEDYQAGFTGNGQDLIFNMTAHSDTTIQVPAGTYSLSVYTNGTYVNRTFTLGARTPVSGVPRADFDDVDVETGSTDLTLSVE